MEDTLLQTASLLDSFKEWVDPVVIFRTIEVMGRLHLFRKSYPLQFETFFNINGENSTELLAKMHYDQPKLRLAQFIKQDPDVKATVLKHVYQNYDSQRHLEIDHLNRAYEANIFQREQLSSEIFEAMRDAPMLLQGGHDQTFATSMLHSSWLLHALDTEHYFMYEEALRLLGSLD